jgi:hypothetical protein
VNTGRSTSDGASISSSVASMRVISLRQTWFGCLICHPLERPAIAMPTAYLRSPSSGAVSRTWADDRGSMTPPSFARWMRSCAGPISALFRTLSGSTDLSNRAPVVLVQVDDGSTVRGIGSLGAISLGDNEIASFGQVLDPPLFPVEDRDIFMMPHDVESRENALHSKTSQGSSCHAILRFRLPLTRDGPCIHRQSPIRHLSSVAVVAPNPAMYSGIGL